MLTHGPWFSGGKIDAVPKEKASLCHTNVTWTPHSARRATLTSGEMTCPCDANGVK